MKWIKIEELLIIHETVIKETGGIQGIINWGALESALMRPFTSFEGNELFPDLWSKIAVLIHSIVIHHPFLDGNKRTALVAGDVCLRLNGWRLVPSDDVDTFFWSIARGEQSVEKITEWPKSHSEQYSV